MNVPRQKIYNGWRVGITACLSLLVAIGCLLHFFNTALPMRAHGAEIEWNTRASYHHVDLGNSIDAMKIIPSGRYEVYATGYPLSPSKRGRDFDYSTYFYSPGPPPECIINVRDSFGVKEMREAILLKNQDINTVVRNKEFNAYARLGSKVYLFNENLMFDGKNYYLADQNFYIKVFERIALRCKFLP